MNAPAVLPPIAAATPASLVDVLGQRNVWLLFVLGFGVGLPVHAAWHDNFPRLDVDVGKSLYLSMTEFGTAGLIALAAAPFLDHRHVFGRVWGGRRKSWVATILSATLILMALFIVALLTSERASMRFFAIAGAPAMLVSGLLWIAIDALRIDLHRGRAQAIAIAAQYMGALASERLLTALALQGPTVTSLAVCAALLLAGLGAVRLMRETERPAAAPSGAAAEPISISYARPWRTFFAWNGRASPYLLAAIAFYALAASTAEFLGRYGYTAELLRTDLRQFDAALGDALTLIGRLTTPLTAAGVVAGALVAFSAKPARAFSWMAVSALAMACFYVVCKIGFGLTIYTVPALYVLRTLISSGAFIVFIAVTARLTAAPDTAGHVAIISVVGGMLWIGNDALNPLAELLGTVPLAAFAVVAAMTSLLFMRLAARAAARATRANAD